jgi:hypothetical protein
MMATGLAVVSFAGATAVVVALLLFVFVFFLTVDLFAFFLAAGAWAWAVPRASEITEANKHNLITRFFISKNLNLRMLL